MKKSLRLLYLLLIFPLLSCFSLAGCSFIPVDWNINDGFDNDNYIPPDYSFNISATSNNIVIDAKNIGDYGEEAKIVALPIYEYLYDEETKGLAEETSATPIELASYECGTTKQFVFDRYFNETSDAIYYKYFVLSDSDEILAGPMFCTEIEPIFKHEVPIKPVNKKGITCEDIFDPVVTDLGCSYTEINFVIDAIIVPNERFVNGKVVKINWEENTNTNGELTISAEGRSYVVDYLDYNGERYYFRLASFEYYDKLIKEFTDRDVIMTLILLLPNILDQYIQPYFLKYPNTEATTTFMQPNTSNRYGAGYWGALMEFLAKRYSSENSEYGYVQAYILGNEIDGSFHYNAIVGPGQAAPLLEDYMEEYEREMRISNQAIKKYHPNNQIYISLTHFWNSSYEDYVAKEIVDYLTAKTLRQGNYDFGLTVHPYGVSLTKPEFWKGDLATNGFNGSLNSTYITWSNLEVLQLYLEQPSKLCNGKVRSVYITEGGVASSSSGELKEITKMQQAAGVAYLYYKATQLSCVKAVSYYRLLDNVGDGAYFGLLNGNWQKKPAYDVWKYIDTQYSFDVSMPYLKYIEWTTMDGWTSITHSVETDVTSYKDTMKLVESKFDWDTNWNEDLIMVRNIDEPFYG